MGIGILAHRPSPPKIPSHRFYLLSMKKVIKAFSKDVQGVFFSLGVIVGGFVIGKRDWYLVKVSFICYRMLAGFISKFAFCRWAT